MRLTQLSFHITDEGKFSGSQLRPIATDDTRLEAIGEWPIIKPIENQKRLCCLTMDSSWPRPTDLAITNKAIPAKGSNSPDTSGKNLPSAERLTIYVLIAFSIVNHSQWFRSDGNKDLRRYERFEQFTPEDKIRFNDTKGPDMNTNTSVEIMRPISEVFRYTTENVSDWSITVIEDEVLEETPEKVGTTFRIMTEERGRKMEMTGVVTRYETDRLNEVHLISKAFDIDALYEFEDLGDGNTRVTETATVYPKGFAKVIFFLIGWAMKKSNCDALQKELDSLKEQLESGAGTAR